MRNGIIPANADATPGWLETWAAGTSLDATLSRKAQGTTADLDPCSVPQAHGQASARRRTGMAKCRELRLIVMEISIASLLEGATRATGSVAVIDVFRAFTSAAVALANGASKIVMVRTVKEALELRQAGIGEICMGEVHGRAPDGFDFGNSPFEVSTVDFQGKTIIQRTSAGTQGIVEAATKAERLYAASLVTAEATVRALLSASPDQISLVAMGDNGLSRTDEDELCAIHLRNRLEGRPGNADAVRRLILAGGEVRRFQDPARPYLHPEDVDIALDIDRYDFAIRVEFENGRPVARVERPA
jgi:2-phosphosulfolactate phosphatase